MKHVPQKVRATILSACLMSNCLLPASAEGTAPAGFDEFVNKALNEWGNPGACIAVVKDGKVFYSSLSAANILAATSRVDQRRGFPVH
jgi:hypothetical protein